MGGALIFVLCMTILLRNMFTLFPWNILTVLLRYIFTVFLGHLVTHFLGLVVTLCDWDYSSYSHLYIMALGYWYWTTDWLQNFITFLFVLIIPVWNLDSVTLLFVDILAVLLHYLPALLPGHIFTLGVRYLLTYLSRFIPTLFLSIHINNAFSFSNSCAHLLSHCITHFISSFVTLLVIYSLALLFLDRSTFLLSNSFTLLFISML